jgi:hypothetical protein
MEKRTANDRPIAEAALESSEVIADVLMRGEVLAEIPLIGTAIKICKAADSIRDRAFAIKLSRFILNLESVTDEQKAKLKEKMNAGTDEAQKIGETLFFVLERVTDLDKPSLLAQIFMAYIDGVVTSEELRRLCLAVDVAFAGDLQQLLTIDKISEKSEEFWMQQLVASGLTRIIAGKTFDESGMLFYELTPLGETLRKAYSYEKVSS